MYETLIQQEGYESNGSNEDPLYFRPDGETLDVFEFVARVLF